MARPRTDIAPRILEAAKLRFRQHGVDGASLRAIAKDAKTSIGMVYYYYPTKDDLFFAVVETAYEGFLRKLEIALAPEGTTEERLGRLYRQISEVTDEEVEMLRLVVRDVLTSSTRFERLLARFMRGHVPLVLRTVLEGLGDGTFDRRHHPVVLVLATFALAGPPQLIRRALGSKVPIPGAPEGAELAKAMLDVLLHGVMPRATG
jgi:AcrR family transcriptional regulator